jgi:hypothetical protein
MMSWVRLFEAISLFGTLCLATCGDDSPPSLAYTNQQYGFSLEVPRDMSLQTSGYSSLHPFANPPIAYVFANVPATQTEGYLTVNVSTNSFDVAKCMDREHSLNVLLGSIFFHRTDSPAPDAISGLKRNYSTIRNDKCLDLEIIVFPSACLVCDHHHWSWETERALFNRLDAVAMSCRFDTSSHDVRYSHAP